MRAAPDLARGVDGREHHRSSDPPVAEPDERGHVLDLRIVAVQIQLAMPGRLAVDAGDEESRPELALVLGAMVRERHGEFRGQVIVLHVRRHDEVSDVGESALLDLQRTWSIGLPTMDEGHLVGRFEPGGAEPHLEPIRRSRVAHDHEPVLERAAAQDLFGRCDQVLGGHALEIALGEEEVREEPGRKVVVEEGFSPRERDDPRAHAPLESSLEVGVRIELVHRTLLLAQRSPILSTP